MRSFNSKTLITWALIIVSSVIVSQTKWGYIGINTSDSLPHSIYLVIRDKEVSKGNYAAFFVTNNPFFSPETIFVKKVVGIPGDVVYQMDNLCFVNETEIGKILHETKIGQLLHPGSTGLLSEGMYFMAGIHERSFDSRYKEMDWIHENNIIGRAYPIF